MHDGYKFWKIKWYWKKIYIYKYKMLLERFFFRFKLKLIKRNLKYITLIKLFMTKQIITITRWNTIWQLSPQSGVFDWSNDETKLNSLTCHHLVTLCPSQGRAVNGLRSSTHWAGNKCHKTNKPVNILPNGTDIHFYPSLKSVWN